MDNDRLCSCYPEGVLATRRAFLGSLAAAAAVAGVSSTALALDGEIRPAEEPIPGFPPGGFPDGSVQLNFNENPLGPSPKAMSALIEGGLRGASRYNYIDPLVEAIARHHGISAESVLVGCGSTEFLQFTPWAYLNDGGSIVLPSPSYGWSGGVAQAMGREAIRVPLGTLGRVDVTAMKKAIRSDTRMVYVANPNNPTGAPIAREEIVALAETVPTGGVLIVDEAYHDFLPDGDGSLDLVRRDLPVLVLRTFSKAYGLAGLRLGYAVGSAAVLERVRRVWRVISGSTPRRWSPVRPPSPIRVTFAATSNSSTTV